MYNVRGVGTDNVIPLVQTTNKSTKSNSTNYNSTKNLSSGLAEKQDNQVENTESGTKDSEREDSSKSENQALFDYALEKIKDNSKIGDKVSYAKVMVRNWEKRGIKSVSQLESSMTKTNSKSTYVENMPSWYQQQSNTGSQSKSDDYKDKWSVVSDIARLKTKLGC